ncbi:phytanoyl-CoA dioxygenase family protein [Psychrobacter sp. DM4]|uniref:phytanoyl-CoA dioxygenase family protein n=1 Tax=Psychrobacter sp. DM4 TaxID=3440637 RepID=UPI003F50200F
MRFIFLNHRVILNKSELYISKVNKADLIQKDINYVDKDNIKKIIENGESFYKNKLSDISLNPDDKDLESITVSKLERDGIVVVPNYLDVSEVDELCKLIDNESEKYLFKLGSNKSYENSSVIIQKGLVVKKSFNELVSSDKPVINIRSGADEGMVDIFNVDRLMLDKSSLGVMGKIINDVFINNFLSSLPQKMKIENVNFYANNGITSTRGFHTDSFSKHIKIFIYLTDVLSFDNGPYTFIKGSHLDTPYRRINRHISKALKAETESPIVPFENVYPVLAPKGSLVISDQSGFHRGFPQTANGSRRALVINCICI